MSVSSAKASLGSKSGLRKVVSRLWPLEFIILCALSIPIFFASSILLAFSTYTAMPWGLVGGVYTALWCFAIFYAFYRLAARCLAQRLTSARSRMLIAAILVFLPFLFMLYVFGILEFLYDFENQMRVTIALALSCFSAGFAFEILHTRKQSLTANPKAPHIFLTAFCVTLFCFVILSYQEGNNSLFWTLVFTFVSPVKEILSALLVLPVFLIVSSFSPAASYVFLAGLVFLILALGWWAVSASNQVKSPVRKGWQRAIGLAIVAYGVYLLLPLNAPLENGRIYWQVPAVSAARSIQHKEAGILSTIGQNVQMNVDFTSSFVACKSNNVLTVTQYFSPDAEAPSSSFIIDANLLEGKLSSDVFRKKRTCGTCSSDDLFLDRQDDNSVADGFECISDRAAEGLADAEGASKETFSNPCNKLTYMGKEVLTSGEYEGVYITQILLSQDKNWALISTDLGADVYLADLRKLQ
jgi:hypothetical protein